MIQATLITNEKDAVKPESEPSPQICSVKYGDIEGIGEKLSKTRICRISNGIKSEAKRS